MDTQGLPTYSHIICVLLRQATLDVELALAESDVHLQFVAPGILAQHATVSHLEQHFAHRVTHRDMLRESKQYSRQLVLSHSSAVDHGKGVRVTGGAGGGALLKCAPLKWAAPFLLQAEMRLTPEGLATASFCPCPRHDLRQ